MSKFGKAVWSVFGWDLRNEAAIEKMCIRLSDGGFDLIIAQVDGYGEVFYFATEKGKIGPNFQGQDPLRTLVVEAHKRGLKVHAWLNDFLGDYGLSLEKNPALATVDRDRNSVKWADPAKDEVQNYKFSLYEEIMDGYEVDGVHLDHIRYKNENICFCDHCKEEFSRYCPDVYHDPAKIPPNQYVDSQVRDQAWSYWVDWRANNITKFVERVSKAARKKGVEVSAAVFPNYPTCYAHQGQDWALWTERGYLDYLFPMTYTNNPRFVAVYTRNHIAQVKGACPVWEGLCPWLPLTTHQVLEEMKLALKEGAQGIVLFSYGFVSDSLIETLKKLEAENR